MVCGVEHSSANKDGSPRLELIGRFPEGHEHGERLGRRCGRRGREGELSRELAAGVLGTPIAGVLPVLARARRVLGAMLVPMRVPIPVSVSNRSTFGGRENRAPSVPEALDTAGRDVREPSNEQQPDDRSVVPDGFQRSTHWPTCLR